MNGGFEYLGMDFILSEGGKTYLLEVNAPPSQDTATGLSHAENLHNAVMIIISIIIYSVVPHPGEILFIESEVSLSKHLQVAIEFLSFVFLVALKL